LIRERLLHLLERRERQDRPFSQNDVARRIGVSAAAVSNFVNHKDVGDVAKLAGALKAFVEREEARDEDSLLRLPFVQTRQAKEMMRANQFCHRFGRMAAVLGGSGWGKSRAIAEAVAQDRSLVLLKAWNRMGASGVLQDLCEGLKVSDSGLLRALMKRIKARLAGSGRCVIVDDAHTLSFGALDVLRHIYDETGVGMLLVGIDKLKRHLIGTSEELEQIASRVSGRIWELPEIRESDLVLILRAVMRESDVEPAMQLLRRDPTLLTSVRRMSNFLEIAGSLASRNGGVVTMVHLKQALKYAA
jgi:hypothetical protein